MEKYKFAIEIEAENKETATQKIQTFVKLDCIFGEKLNDIAIMLEQKPELINIIYELDGKSKNEIIASLPKIISKISKIL